MSNQTPPFDHEHDLLNFADRLADGQEPTASNDLESTMLRVQRSLRSDAADPDAMPADLKTHIWEDIMQITGAAPAAAPETPWQGAAPQSKRRARRKATRPASRPLPPQRMRWSGAANIALTVLLIVAAFGAVRAFEGSLPFDLGGGNGPSEPRLAAVPGTPDESLLPAVQMTPEATLDAAFACDLSNDIPIIPDVSSSPLNGISLYITPRDQGINFQAGTLMLHCAEEQADVELKQRVVSASAGPIPGVVRLSVLPEGASTLEEQIPAYLNLTTGQSIEFAGISSVGSMAENDWSSIPGSPWVVGRNADNPELVEIANLQTMETRSLADLTGSEFASGTEVPGVGVVSDNGVTVLAYTLPYTGPGEGGTIMRDTGAPGDLMVLGENFDSIRWVDLPDSLDYVRDIWLSPDGSAIALSVFDGPTQFEGTHSYAIVNAEDGTLLGQSEPISSPGNPLVLWIQDGEAITYAADDTVQVLRAEMGAEPDVVLEPGQDVSTVRTTYDPDTIVASIRMDHGSDADPASTDIDRVYSVNVATGESHEFDGMEIGDIHSQMIPQANVLLMYEFVSLERPVMVSAYDPVSGMLVEDLGELPSPHSGRMTVGKDSFSSSPEEGTTVFTIGWQTILLVQVEDGSSTLQRVETPTEGTSAADAVLSPDGEMLSMVNNADESRTRWLLDLSDPDAEWTDIPNEAVSSDPGMVQFIEGTGN